ncbi:MAG: hypothetical protein QXJ20_02315 [Candidatus Aenigmatarchaeota archaeon]
MLTNALKEKVDLLVNEIPELIKKFNGWGYRKGPDLYFYKKIMTLVKNKKLKELIDDTNFIELVYATLTSFDMNARGAKMKYFDEFYENVTSCKDQFVSLSEFKLENLSERELEVCKAKLSELFGRLDIMVSKGKIVPRSKLMHFLLPNLVMPIDRQNTLRFFYGSRNEFRPESKFIEIFESSWNIAKRINLSIFLDNNWNQTIPKLIDNAIIAKMSLR